MPCMRHLSVFPGPEPAGNLTGNTDRSPHFFYNLRLPSWCLSRHQVNTTRWQRHNQSINQSINHVFKLGIKVNKMTYKIRSKERQTREKTRRSKMLQFMRLSTSSSSLSSSSQ